VLLPYWRAHREQGLARTLEEAAAFASTPANYLATPGRLHHSLWSHRFFGASGGAFFPGLAGLALAAAALRDGGWRATRVGMLIAIAGAGVVLSLGPATPAYSLLHAAFPPMKGLRDPSRFGYLPLLSIALLAPIGLAALRRRAGGRAGALALLAIAAVNVEALAAPMRYVAFEGFSPIYARVAEAAPGAVLAEFPFYPAADVYRNAEYVLASTEHWRPLVNGYSGFTPPGFAQRAEILRRFPDEAAFAELHRLGVTHVAVHLARYREPRRVLLAESLDSRSDLERLETGPAGERLYVLKRPAP
jgi:hypothetical protein